MRPRLLGVALLIVCSSCSRDGGGDSSPDVGGSISEQPCEVCDAGVVAPCDAGDPVCEVECQADDDCPGSATAPFVEPVGTRCIVSLTEGWHCSECIHDEQCEPGWGCRATTYCEAFGPCESASECAGVLGAVHDACIEGQCVACSVDADCDEGELCIDRRCADRDRVDERCADETCEGACEVQYDFSGRPTGVACLGSP